MSISHYFKYKKDWSDLLFFGIVFLYCIIYAPVGINETDGGFIDGLAWRVLNGELIYQDFIYVRPPLSVYWRALELALIPEYFEVLSGRVLFYLYIVFTSYLAATLFFKGPKKWLLATFAFIVSVHNYPAAPWHTVHGIVCAVCAVYFLCRRARLLLLSALFSVLAMLCKQSFYPIFLTNALLCFLLYDGKKTIQLILYQLIYLFLFFGLLFSVGILDDFFFWTQGATQISDVIQFAGIDYLRINKWVALTTIFLLPVFFFWNKKSELKKYAWFSFLVSQCVVFIYENSKANEFIYPGDQIRLLFLITVAWLLFSISENLDLKSTFEHWKQKNRHLNILLALLAISWMVSVSWGYNAPILFSLPIIYGLFRINEKASFGTSTFYHPLLRFGLIALLLLTFSFGYQQVYRDGNRTNLYVSLSSISPKLTGIRSSAATNKKYEALLKWSHRYECFSVLPAFPQAHYLTGTVNPLPLDWLIRVEYNGQKDLILERLQQLDDCVLLIEKSYTPNPNQPQKFEIIDWVKSNWRLIDEDEDFWVYRQH